MTTPKTFGPSSTQHTRTLHSKYAAHTPNTRHIRVLTWQWRRAAVIKVAAECAPRGRSPATGPPGSAPNELAHDSGPEQQPNLFTVSNTPCSCNLVYLLCRMRRVGTMIKTGAMVYRRWLWCRWMGLIEVIVRREMGDRFVWVFLLRVLCCWLVRWWMSVSLWGV